jgi:hypothetical protein
MDNPQDIDPVIEAFHDWYDVMVQIKGHDMQHGIAFCRALYGGPHDIASDDMMAAQIFAAFIIILYKAVENFEPISALRKREDQLQSPRNAQHWTRSQEIYLGIVTDCAERMQGKAFFASSKYMGTSLHYMKNGDVIYALLGCSYPVILCRHRAMFEFIREAYIDGLMLGEAIGKLECDMPKSPFTVQESSSLYLHIVYSIQLS